VQGTERSGSGRGGDALGSPIARSSGDDEDRQSSAAVHANERNRSESNCSVASTVVGLSLGGSSVASDDILLGRKARRHKFLTFMQTYRPTADAASGPHSQVSFLSYARSFRLETKPTTLEVTDRQFTARTADIDRGCSLNRNVVLLCLCYVHRSQQSDPCFACCRPS
jgi:hypothetical protein